MSSRPQMKVLMVGLNPSVVDYNDPIATPHADPQTVVTPEKLKAEAERARQALLEKGCVVEWSFWGMLPNSLEILSEKLQSFEPDCVMLGAGLRLNPRHTEIFESCVNAVRKHAPAATLCFNAGPEDMLGPVLRQIE